MYAIYGNIYHQYTPNVSIYTSTNGSYGVESPFFSQAHHSASFDASDVRTSVTSAKEHEGDDSITATESIVQDGCLGLGPRERPERPAINLPWEINGNQL